MKPTKFLGKWSRRDQILAQALLMYEASLNEQGIPSWIAQDPDRKFVLDEITDEAAALLENAQKTETLNPGVRLRVIDKGPIPDDE